MELRRVGPVAAAVAERDDLVDVLLVDALDVQSVLLGGVPDVVVVLELGEDRLIEDITAVITASEDGDEDADNVVEDITIGGDGGGGG